MFPNPFFKHYYAYIKDTNLKVEVVHIDNAFVKSRDTYVDYAVIWFDWKPTPEIMSKFIQYRPREEAIMNQYIATDLNQAAIDIALLTEGPTEQELGKVLYD